MKTKLITHNKLKAKLMLDDEFKKLYEEEERQEKLQKLLDEWRISANLTKKDIAKKLNVNPSTVNRMYANVEKASIKSILNYAKACGIEHPVIAL